MENIHSTPLTKAILTGVFAGFIATVLCMIYNAFFRGATGFSPSYIVNISSLIFVINLLFLIIGFIFYGFLQVRKGELLYIAFFVLVTVVVALVANRIHRSDVALLNTEFHQLVVPMVIIMGLIAGLGIPYLFHNKKFEENVL